MIVATEQGELLLLSYSGELIEKIATSPFKRIISMYAYSRGIIVAGERGQIWVYEQVQSEHQPALRLLHANEKITLPIETDSNIADPDQEREASITSLALNKSEDCLYLMTDTKQILSVNNISLDGTESENFNF